MGLALYFIAGERQKRERKGSGKCASILLFLRGGGGERKEKGRISSFFWA